MQFYILLFVIQEERGFVGRQFYRLRSYALVAQCLNRSCFNHRSFWLGLGGSIDFDVAFLAHIYYEVSLDH